MPTIDYFYEEHGGVRAAALVNGQVRWVSDWAPDEKSAANDLIKRLALWNLELHAIADRDAEASRVREKEDHVAAAWARIIGSLDFVTYSRWVKKKNFPAASPMTFGSVAAWLQEIGVNPKP
jgi:hypothetical protein